METPTASSQFQELIIRRLEANRSDIAKHREAMDQTMRELEERGAQFHKIAGRLRDELLQPTLAAFAEHFDNADVEDVPLGYCSRCHLRHSTRFPAAASVMLRIVHDETIQSLTVQYEAQILPVFIRFERSDTLDLLIAEIQSETVQEWIERKLLGFLDSYMQIETHEQYQRDNVALDPVCGMRVQKPKGVAYVHDDQEYFFCAARCLHRFLQNPSAYVRSEKS